LWRVGLVLVPVLALGATGGVLLAGAGGGSSSGCGGHRGLTVLAAPDIAPTLSSLAADFSAHGGDQECGPLRVAGKDPAASADAFAAGWREDREGPAPDVWVPDSSLWLRDARARAGDGTDLPDSSPSLAYSPLLIAMPEPMARAVGWPGLKVTWSQMLSLLRTSDGWAGFGHPEWGPPRIGMTSPATSTPAREALVAVAAATSGHLTASTLPVSVTTDVSVKVNLLALGRIGVRTAPDSAALLAGLRQAAARGEKDALSYVSAMPLHEHDVLAYNRASPKVALAAVYPADGVPAADYPYAVRAGGGARARVAADFLAYLRTPASTQRLVDDGFRIKGHTLTAVNSPFSFRNGLDPAAPEVTLASTPAATVDQLIKLWAIVSKPAKTLSVYDLSGSMRDVVPNTGGKTKIEFCQEAARAALPLFTDSDDVGVWTFATKMSGTLPYRVEVPAGPLGGKSGHGTRRDAIIKAIGRLQPTHGDTALYETVLAAYADARRGYDPDRTNTVIVLTDGREDVPGGGMSLAAALDKLRPLVDPTRPVRVVGVAYGADVDVPALRALSSATGGKTYLAPQPSMIGIAFLDAITSF
jgi:Ca-activated chloride channel family protein